MGLAGMIVLGAILITLVYGIGEHSLAWGLKVGAVWTAMAILLAAAGII